MRLNPSGCAATPVQRLTMTGHQNYCLFFIDIGPIIHYLTISSLIVRDVNR